MLHSIRKFTGSIYAKIFLVIVILPFVFWGMGDVFRGGRLNTIVEIDDKKIPTSEFTDYINSLGLNLEDLNEKTLESTLANFISLKLIDVETKKLKLIIPDTSLVKIIKNDESFKKDEKFSRTKYEKFLITSGLTAARFEIRIKQNETKKQLFDFISGGVKSPNFMVNKVYNSINQVRNILTIDLNDIYKKELKFSEKEIKIFYNENINNFTELLRSIKYSKITPKLITGKEEYDNFFFEKIDEIDDSISSGSSIEKISKKFNLNLKISKLFNENGEQKDGQTFQVLPKDFIKEIFNLELSDPLVLLNKKDNYFLIKLEKNENIPQDISNSKVRNEILIALKKKKIIKKNSEIIEKIVRNEFTKNSFDELASKNSIKIKKIKLKGVNDTSSIDKNLVANIYKLPEKKIYIFSDEKLDNNLLVYLDKIEHMPISKNIENYEEYFSQANMTFINNIYATYDKYINKTYKVDINYKAFEKIKNYLR